MLQRSFDASAAGRAHALVAEEANDRAGVDRRLHGDATNLVRAQSLHARNMHAGINPRETVSTVGDRCHILDE